MAKTVSDIFLKLKVEGTQGLDKLKGSFRALEKSLGPTNASIAKLRTEIIEFSQTGNRSVQSIKGQIEAFKGLREQATIGSTVYRRLGDDITRLTRSLEGLGNETQKQSRRGQAAGFVFGQTPSAESEKFQRQIAAGNELLSRASVTGREYADTLSLLTARLDAFNRAQARQAVAAKYRATTGLAATPRSLAQQVQLPDTLAGLRLRIAELSTDIDNLEIGSEAYRAATEDLTAAQRALNEVLGQSSAAYDELERREQGAIRRAEKLKGIQEYYATQGPTAPGVGGYRDPVTGAMIARGTRAGRQPLPVERPMREISGLYQQIGQIGMSGITADIERMGKSYSEVAIDIKRATAASNGSITSLQAQRTAWASLSSTLNPASREYREVSQEIERVERRLDRLTKKQKLSARIKGNLGAAAAGAVFGGPEAAIGGLVGGPVGAGLGATASIARQQLGDFAAFAAEVEKLEIALEGVTKTQEAYQYSLETARRATQDFNIPIDAATRNITRLSAAVLGAGGNVGDAELVFRNVTAAVKATGGSADDVNSAITAMVQVFSKGKVSAEELSGQLGERLPGAVTLFAKAVYGEGHGAMLQLQKDLKDGSVGLNELMKFAQVLGVEYVDLAKEIAQSNADAGQKAAAAWADARRQIGEALAPIGAELQAALTNFLVENQAEILTLAQVLSEVFKALLDVLAFLVKNFEELVAVAAVVASTAGLVKVVAVVKNLGGVASVASMAVSSLSTSITGVGIAGATVATGGVALLVGGFAALTIGLYNAAFGSKIFAEEVGKGKRPMREAREELDRLYTSLEDYQERLEAAGRGQGAMLLTQQIRNLKLEIQGLNEAVEQQIYAKKGKGFIGPLPLSGDPDAEQARYRQYMRTNFPAVTDDSKGGSGTKRKLMTEAEANLRIKILGYKEKEQAINAINAQFELDTLLANQETEDIQKRRVMLEEAEAKRREAIYDLMKGIGDLQMKQMDLDRDLNKELEDRKYALGLITREQYNQLLIERERKRLEEAYPGEGFAGKRAELEDLYRQEIDPTTAEGLRKNIAKLKEELEDLVNPVNQITSAANAIGSAFTQSFTSVINGSATTQEALASFFQNVANYFLDMAAQIIQKMITMAILNAVVGLLPGGGGVKGAPMNMPSGIGDSYKGLLTSAKGNVFNGGLKRYAMGGIVDKPTLFTYANGGTGRFGLLGEAGPEAIIPLKRGADGKLGVAGGGGVNVGEINITVENTGEQLSPAAQKQIANQVQGIVMATLVNERRSGGVLR